jgi:membrane-associated phospholipid phosphatase
MERWLGGTVNAMMLAATPIDGSHYFVDVVAGVAIAMLALLMARAIVARLAAHPAPAKAALAPVAQCAGFAPLDAAAHRVPAE